MNPGTSIGDIRVLPVIDGQAVWNGAELYRLGNDGRTGRGLETSDWDSHPQFLDEEGRMTLELGGYLVLPPDGRVILVDLGLGPTSLGPFKGGAMIENLRDLGFAPEDVSDVVYTHLHGDHIGWTSVDGRVTFPNATHRCDARDLAHFYGPDEGVTIRLMAAADRIETWDGDETLAAGVDLRPMPGHTPGSTVVVLSSGTQRALLLGDVVHCPVELVDDEWEGLGDVDPALARKVRNAMARELDDGEVLIGAAHFPGLRFGRLLAGSTARRWVISEALT